MKYCTTGPIPRAKTAVPSPAVPPRAMPARSTVASMIVRVALTLRPYRDSPIISPSRGPVPSPAPM